MHKQIMSIHVFSQWYTQTNNVVQSVYFWHVAPNALSWPIILHCFLILSRLTQPSNDMHTDAVPMLFGSDHRSIEECIVIAASYRLNSVVESYLVDT